MPRALNAGGSETPYVAVNLGSAILPCAICDWLTQPLIASGVMPAAKLLKLTPEFGSAISMLKRPWP